MQVIIYAMIMAALRERLPKSPFLAVLSFRAGDHGTDHTPNDVMLAVTGKYFTLNTIAAGR